VCRPPVEPQQQATQEVLCPRDSKQPLRTYATPIARILWSARVADGGETAAALRTPNRLRSAPAARERARGSTRETNLSSFVMTARSIRRGTPRKRARRRPETHPSAVAKAASSNP